MTTAFDMYQDDYLTRLARPKGKKVDVVIDTDTYNEIDDQFALVYAIKSPEAINLKAIYAAPFHNERSTGAANGMELSFAEIGKILEMTGRSDLLGSSFRGSEQFLPDEDTAVGSDAVTDLLRRSEAYSIDNPLYVIALGAITNIASALLLDKTLHERIVVIWLGGHALDWPDTREFNMAQDVAAARVLFKSQVPLVQLPCMGVVSAFTLTEPDMKAWLGGRNTVCDYLVNATIAEAKSYVQSHVWSRVIWDVTAVAWLISADFMSDRLEYAPLPQYDHHYTLRRDSHFYRYVYHINKDRLMQDLVEKLTR